MPTGITRETVVRCLRENEQTVKDNFLVYAQEVLANPMPHSLIEKFLSRGEEYGEFDIEQDWLRECDGEIWDGVAYCELNRVKIEWVKSCCLYTPQLLDGKPRS